MRSVSLSFSCMWSPRMSSRSRSLNSSLGHTSLESSRLASFLKRLVQGCFCRWWSPPGASWPHCKVSSLGSYNICDLILRSTRFSRVCIVVCGSGHYTSISWAVWRSSVPINSPLPFKFLYTKGVVPQVRVAGCHSSADHPYIDYLELLYFSRQFRCVIKPRVRYLWR